VEFPAWTEMACNSEGRLKNLVVGLLVVSEMFWLGTKFHTHGPGIGFFISDNIAHSLVTYRKFNINILASLTVSCTCIVAIMQ
jgi:hypothetical protein